LIRVWISGLHGIDHSAINIVAPAKQFCSPLNRITRIGRSYVRAVLASYISFDAFNEQNVCGFGVVRRLRPEHIQTFGPSDQKGAGFRFAACGRGNGGGICHLHILIMPP